MGLKQLFTEGKIGSADYLTEGFKMPKEIEEPDDVLDTLEDNFAQAEQIIDDLEDALSYSYGVSMDFNEKEFQKRWKALKQFMIDSMVQGEKG